MAKWLDAGARHLSVCAHHDLDPCAARFTSLLRLRRGAGRARDHRDAAGSFPYLSHRADHALDREPRRAGRNRRVQRADPDPFRLSPRHQHRSGAVSWRRSSSVDATAARRVRHARSRRHGRRDRQRHASSCRPAHPSRLPCSAPRASTIRCAGSTTTPAPIRSTSRTS